MNVVVVLSGGLDSSTVLGMLARDGWQCFPLVFNYKQRHEREITSARSVADVLRRVPGNRVDYLRIVDISGLDFGASALTSPGVDVPRSGVEAGKIPVTYVPARNSIFLSIAMSYAESLGAQAVATGFNAVDYSGYPDCRPEYVEAMEAALALGTRRGVEGNPIKILAPVIGMTKTQVLQKAIETGVPYQHTWSCYVGQRVPCGECDSCRIRAAAFKELGLEEWPTQESGR